MAPPCPIAATEVLFLNERLALPGPLATLAERDGRAPVAGARAGAVRGASAKLRRTIYVLSNSTRHKDKSRRPTTC